MNLNSVFKEKSEAEHFPLLDKEIDTEVVIIGGGITGMVSALLLNEAGLRTVVLEALHIGDGTTGFSSAHLTTDLDFEYQHIYDSFGKDIMNLVAESRIKGIDLIEKIIEENNISCNFKRVNGYYYTENADYIESIEKEFKYARKAGLDVSIIPNAPLPFKTLSTLNFRNQAQFDSQQFLDGIAEVLRHSNCSVYENTRAINMVKKKDRLIIETPFGKVSASKVIMATHTPLFMNVIQSMIAPYNSYVLTAKLQDNNYPEGLFWDTNEPYYYLRTYTDATGSLLMAGGADHKAGYETDTMDSFEQLETYVRERFNIESILHKWSGMYFEPADGLPYIGNTHFSDNVYVATGFSGDGLVYGPIAAQIFRDLILGKKNQWMKAFDSKRFTPVASAENFIRENMDNVRHFVKDRIVKKEKDPLSHLKPLEGKVMKINGEKMAVSKDENEEIHAVSPFCSHLQCVVHWNTAEQVWECPCHGSRFDNEGKVLYGPAVTALEKKEIEQAEVEMKKKNSSS